MTKLLAVSCLHMADELYKNHFHKPFLQIIIFFLSLCIFKLFKNCTELIFFRLLILYFDQNLQEKSSVMRVKIYFLKFYFPSVGFIKRIKIKKNNINVYIYYRFRK